MQPLANLTNKQIILASGSPRRRELLGSIHPNFEVRVTDVVENFPANLIAEEVPIFLARLKASAILPSLSPNDIAITADTVVVVNNTILNKPVDADEARSMLRKLSGTTHRVITACSIFSNEKQIECSDTVQVAFRELLSSEIDYYIEHFKPFDKAGAYGIQEWIGMVGIERIEGSYYTVMGLPVHKIYNALIQF
jgi:septum formation protein